MRKIYQEWFTKLQHYNIPISNKTSKATPISIPVIMCCMLGSGAGICLSEHNSFQSISSSTAKVEKENPAGVDSGKDTGAASMSARAAAAAVSISARAVAAAMSLSQSISPSSQSISPSSQPQSSQPQSSQPSSQRDLKVNKNGLLRLDTKTSSNILVSCYSVKGDRPYMEDTYYVSSNNSFAAVFDGHGGIEVAQYLRDRMYPKLYKIVSENPSMDVKQSFTQTFKELSDAILDKRQWNHIGSTAIAVLCAKDKIWSANLGDCRAVLCRRGQTIDISMDHKPNNYDELKRIEAVGGKVAWHGWVDPDGNPILEMGAYRINGNLAVSRAFGDKDQRPFVSSEPDILSIDRDLEGDHFIVLASDGLWDVIDSDGVVKFVNNVLDAEVGGRGSWRSGNGNDTSVSLSQWKTKYSNDTAMILAAVHHRKLKMAQYLVQEALRNNSSDNISVVVLWFH